MSDQPQPTVEPIFNKPDDLEATLAATRVVRGFGWAMFWIGIAGSIYFFIFFDTRNYSPDGVANSIDLEIARMAGVVIFVGVFLAGVILLMVAHMERTLIQIASQKPSLQR